MVWGPQNAVVALLLLAAACQNTEPSRPPVRPQAAPQPDPCLVIPRRIASEQLPVGPGQPDKAKLAFDEGVQLRLASNWYAAETAFGDAVELNPTFGLAHLELAEALGRTGGSSESRRTHAALAVKDLEHNPRAHVLLADALVGTEQPMAALVHLQCGLSLRPGMRDARRRAVRLAIELSEFEQAEALSMPLSEGFPSPQDYLVMSEVALARGQYKAAGLAVREAADQLKSASLYLRAADYFRQCSDEADALEAERKAEYLTPNNSRNYRPLLPSRRK